MKGNAIENLLRKLVKQAKTEPQKATVLGVLLTIMIVMVVRMGGSASPASASASIATPRGSIAADNNRPRLKTNSAVAALLDWARQPVPPALSRNLFAVNYEYFPQDGTKPAAPVVHVPHGAGAPSPDRVDHVPGEWELATGSVKWLQSRLTVA